MKHSSAQRRQAGKLVLREKVIDDAEGTEHPYQFNSVEQLVEDFRADIERIKTARRKSQS